MCGGGYGWCWPRRSVLDAVDLTGGLPSKRGGAGLVYGGARVGVRLVERGIDADAGVAFERGWPFSVVGLSVARRVRRVCLRLWTTAAMSAASVWAAVPNTRHDSGLKLPSCLIMPLTPSTGLRPA